MCLLVLAKSEKSGTMKLRPSALVSTQKRIPFVVGSPLQTARCLKRPVHVTRNPSSHDCAILPLTVVCPKMCAFYSPPEGVKFLCGTAEAPTRFPSSRLKGLYSSLAEEVGQFHRRAMGAPARFASGGETFVVIHLGRVAFDPISVFLPYGC